MQSAYTFVPSPEHEYPDHPERPGRLDEIQKRLTDFGAQRLPVVPASREQIASVHQPRMISSIEQACRQGPGIIDYAPTYVTRSSFDDALMSAGGVLACTQSVLNGETQRAFAIVRPPGHHAEPGRAMGFCIFNNIAIGARAAFTGGMERVLIVDFDAHHGNGTQAVFLDDPRLTFISTHQWGIYPGTGWIDEAPNSRKRIINVPLLSGAGDRSYTRVMEEIVKPAADSFRPQMMYVSAGFDAHWSDPITTLGLSSAGFFSISKKLVDLADEFCGGKIVFVLEGGYDPQNVANGCAAVFYAMEGRLAAPKAEDSCPNPEPDHSRRIHEILEWHGLK